MIAQRGKATCSVTHFVGKGVEDLECFVVVAAFTKVSVNEVRP